MKLELDPCRGRATKPGARIAAQESLLRAREAQVDHVVGVQMRELMTCYRPCGAMRREPRGALFDARKPIECRDQSCYHGHLLCGSAFNAFGEGMALQLINVFSIAGPLLCSHSLMGLPTPFP